MLSAGFKEVTRSEETVGKGGEKRIRELNLGAAYMWMPMYYSIC